MATLGELSGLRVPRPAHIDTANLCDVYREFERIFLGPLGTCESTIQSKAGMVVRVNDYHFIHLVELEHCVRGDKLHMLAEKPQIISTTIGHGEYSLSAHRAKAFPSARLAIEDPDKIIDIRKRQGTATHCFVRYFGGGSNAYTLTFTRGNEQSGRLVTSFACDESKVRTYEKVGRVMWEMRL